MKWSRWLTWLGVAIAVAGVVIGVWLQTSINDFTGVPHGFNVQQRLEYASVGITTIGAGALLAVAAQIMGMMEASREPRRAPAGVVVAELSDLESN